MRKFLQNKTKSAAFIIIACSLVSALAISIYAFQDIEPEEVVDSAFIERLITHAAFPFKIMAISAQPPDTHLYMPVEGVRVAKVRDSWGEPRPNDRTHEGQDIFAKRGTPVHSATVGYILHITDRTIGGKSVFVIGPGGRRYYYTHFDAYAPDIKPGDKVSTTTLLGFVGTTGNASTTPPHLHFGVYTKTGAIDPLPMLVDRNKPAE